MAICNDFSYDYKLFHLQCGCVCVLRVEIKRFFWIDTTHTLTLSSLSWWKSFWWFFKPFSVEYKCYEIIYHMRRYGIVYAWIIHIFFCLSFSLPSNSFTQFWQIDMCILSLFDIFGDSSNIYACVWIQSEYRKQLQIILHSHWHKFAFDARTV